MSPPVVRFARVAEGERSFWALLEADGRVREAAGDPLTGLEPIGAARGMEGLRWQVPIAPTKIVGIGRNYRAHAAELGHEAPKEPLLFLKPPSSLVANEETIHYPRASTRVDYEGELGVVIGRAARAVPEARALECVLGYTCVNDVTARDLQTRDVQFTRAKGYDTFCPVGPCVATGLDPAALVVETWVNGVRRQSAPAAAMIFGVARLVAAISQVMTLRPGDLIATGTPEGVGPLRPGDQVEVRIEGVGRLRNRVVAAAR